MSSWIWGICCDTMKIILWFDITTSNERKFNLIRIYYINVTFKYVYILRTKVHLYIFWYIRWTSFALTLCMITERITTIVSILIFYSFLNLLSKKMRWQNLESLKVVLWCDTLQANEDWLKLDLTKLLWTSFRTTSKHKES